MFFHPDQSNIFVNLKQKSLISDLNLRLNYKLIEKQAKEKN
jgi:hypothetical protein